MTMSLEDFASEYPSEGEFVEFKSGVGGVPLQDSAVAFSNAQGGVILVGVSDDGTPKGRKLDSGTADDIHQALNAARDVGRYFLNELDVAGRPVTVIAVARRREGFAQTSAGVVRIRRGSRDDALFGADLVRFANERTSLRYETTPVAVDLRAIDAALRIEVREAFDWPRATDELLTTIEFLGGGYLTVAGALFLVRDAEPSLGKCFAEIRRYPDDTTVDYDRRDEIRGPVHHVLVRVVDRIVETLGAEIVVIGAHRHELPRLPQVVIREAVANALAHRSYEIAGTPVLVELRPSAVVIRSPGGLPEPVTVANLRNASAARNRAVITALRRFGLAEDAGRGIDVMLDTMAEQMLDPPRFEDRGHEVVVELPIRSVVAPEERAWLMELERRDTLEPADRLVLVHAARGEVLGNAQARAILGTDDPIAARRVLTRLSGEGFLERRGTRGGATYRLNASLRPPAGLRLDHDQLDEVVAELSRAGAIRNADVRKATGLDRAQALAVLERLTASGRLVRSGQRRGTTYTRSNRL